jgi:hypothetical protein
MKQLPLFFMLALLTAFMVGTAVAADYYVFTNLQGQTLVGDYPPTPGWAHIDGPYPTLDAAMRAERTKGTPGRGTRKTAYPAKAAF